MKSGNTLLIIISGLCGGSVYPLIKIADHWHIPKFAYIFWESLFICGFIVFWACFRKDGKLFKGQESPYYLFCAVTNILIPQHLFFILSPHMPASWVGVTNVLTPLFVYAGLVGFFGERFEKVKIAGLLIGLLGTFFLFLPNLSNTQVGPDWVWLSMSLLLPLDYAVNRIYANRLRPKGSPGHRLIFGFFAIVAAISGVLMFITNSVYVPFLNASPGDAALVAHAILMSIFYLLFFMLSEKGAVRSSLASYVAPLTGVAWGVSIFGEDMSGMYIISTLLIFMGLYLANREPIAKTTPKLLSLVLLTALPFHKKFITEILVSARFFTSTTHRAYAR